MKFNIKVFLEQLANERRLFHNEKDFQFHFTWLLKKIGYDVNLEYYNGMVKGKRTYIDLLAKKGDESIAFEFKYKTKQENVSIGNETYDLFSQGAHDFGSYSVLRDVKRLEQLVEEKKAKEAYVIFLTNDDKYERGFGEKSLFYNYGLNQNKNIKRNKILKFIYKDGVKKEKTCAKNLDEICFNNDYELKWVDYGEKLRCLVIKI